MGDRGRNMKRNCGLLKDRNDHHIIFVARENMPLFIVPGQVMTVRIRIVSAQGSRRAGNLAQILRLRQQYYDL